jgi:hypothetical protein
MSVDRGDERRPGEGKILRAGRMIVTLTDRSADPQDDTVWGIDAPVHRMTALVGGGHVTSAAG